MEEITVRLDLFLKHSRIIPRRAQAKAICEAGIVFINEKTAKPSSNVKNNDIIKVLKGDRTFVFEASVEPSEKKILVGAKLLETYDNRVEKC